MVPCPLLPASTAGQRIDGLQKKVTQGLAIGIVRVHDELERASVEQPHGGEVSNVSRRKATNAEIFREHDDRRVDEAQAEIAVPPVDIHRSSELID